MNKTRLAFFGSSSSFISSIIYNALVKELKNRDDIELVAVIDGVKSDFKSRIMRQDFVTTLLRFLALRVQGHKFTWRYYGAIKGTKIKDINSAECYRILNINHVDAILCVACPQIFGDVLLGYYYCVNYHNSLLPDFKGICSTQWELYNAKLVCDHGYTFHRMVQKIDSGNILIKQRMAFFNEIKNYDDVIQIDVEKAQLTDIEKDRLMGRNSLIMKRLLNCIINRSEGNIQYGDSSYFGQVCLDNLAFGSDELVCFGWTAFPWYYVPKFARRWVK